VGYSAGVESTGSERTASTRVPLDVLHNQTSQFNTSTKQLHLKIKEYKDRISGLERTLEIQRQTEGEITIEDVQRKEGFVQQKREEMRKLEVRLRAFNGLPPDIEASREEVRRAQAELERWRRRREELFEVMGTSR
jgi:HAUS augmin-like complex subunit 1